jgi:hypothetical protein
MMLFITSLYAFCPDCREKGVIFIEKETSKKMGRPTDEPKNHVARLRLSESEHQKLLECCKLTNMTITEVLKLGLDKVYQEYKK